MNERDSRMQTIAITSDQIKFHREQCVYWHSSTSC
jgi:hypothetical protein